MARDVSDGLYIGDIGDASAPSPEIDAVVNLAPTWTESTTHWQPLQDGATDRAAFAAAAWTARREWERGRTVLVCCQCGISRAAAVCASVLRAVTGDDWETCLDRIRAARPAVQPVPGLVAVAKGVELPDVPAR